MNSRQVDGLDAGGGDNQSSKLCDQLALGDVTVSAQEHGKPSLQVKKDEVMYGDCHIFDYQDFKNKPKAARPGSEKDAQRLQHIFKQLNFNVYPYLNLTKSSTCEVLKKASSKLHSPHSKYFICCFLTHGDCDSLCMHDKEIDIIDDILKLFSRSSCPSLSGKPKIFIFQACRGGDCEQGVKVLCNNESTDGDLTDISFNKNNPEYLDFLIANSTYEDTFSFKTSNENKHGSYFIDELCRSLEQFVDKLDLLEILTIVNYRMAVFFESITDDPRTNKKKQMPCIISGLRTEVKFNKPIESFVSPDTLYFDERRKEHRGGELSTVNPSSDQKLYHIKGSKNIKFLSILNTKGNLQSTLIKCTNKLWAVVAAKKYQRSEIKDKSKDELMISLNKFAGGEFSDIDCLICFVASPAKSEHLYTVKGEKFLRRSIIKNFLGKDSLNGKPKIFIFLAFPFTKKPWLTCVSADSTDSFPKSDNIPEHADILEVAITLREPRQLEGVVKKITNILENGSEDLLKALTRINDELFQDHEFYSDDNLDTFTLKSTLTKTLNCRDFSV